MSKKFCPLGFFSFYVNKKEAQAGGGHHCVEEECAIWNEDYGDCSLKVGLDSITSLAETLSSGSARAPRSIEPEASKLSVFDRLRRKTEGQKLPIIDQPPTSGAQTPPPPPPPPPLGSLEIPAQPVPPAPPPPPAIPPIKKDEVLKAPDVPINELPVISVSIEED